ncbi:divalent metal cation transporter, partial [Kitasatospora sp. NPDC059747]
KGFYGIYAGLVVVAAAITLLSTEYTQGLMTQFVQVLAGVLLPSATVFLLLLCNDKAVLGPWVNGPKTNAFTSAVVGVLVMLSLILTAAVVWPDISSEAILWIMAGCGVAGVLVAGYFFTFGRSGTKEDPVDRTGRENWRMPPLETLEKPVMSTARKVGMGALRAYLLIAMIMVIIKVVQTALGH